jgi:hypothetical protein
MLTAGPLRALSAPPLPETAAESGPQGVVVHTYQGE